MQFTNLSLDESGIGGAGVAIKMGAFMFCSTSMWFESFLQQKHIFKI